MQQGRTYNEIISYICSESTLYDVVEIEKGPDKNARPFKGAQGDRYRTHVEALQSLFAA